jgi:hypothetical protein
MPDWLFMTWIIVAFLSMGYETGVDTSFFGKTCYKVAGIIHFTLDFGRVFYLIIFRFWLLLLPQVF